MVQDQRNPEPVSQVAVRSGKRDRTVMAPSDAAEHVIDVIVARGLAVVPLAVSYAFLAGSSEPLQRIFELKLRPRSRPCPILASWPHFLEITRGSTDEVARVERVITAGLPVGVITEPDWSSALAGAIPKDCVDLLVGDGRLALFMNMGGMSDALISAADRRGIVLFGSSANISGRGNSFALSEVPASMLESVDVVCDAGRCKYENRERLASSIVDLSSGGLTRRGIAHEEIARLLARGEDAGDSA